MSWFDTANLASMATKAMKEAQKTLDKALDIDADEQDSKDSRWSASWNKMIKSDSDSVLKDKTNSPDSASRRTSSSSVWGSFGSTLFEATAADQPASAEVKQPPPSSEPVSAQPKKNRDLSTTETDESRGQTNSSGSMKVSESQSSLMEGCSEADLLEVQRLGEVSLKDGGSGDDEFSSTRLVVSCSPDEPSSAYPVQSSYPSSTDEPSQSSSYQPSVNSNSNNSQSRLCDNNQTTVIDRDESTTTTTSSSPRDNQPSSNSLLSSPSSIEIVSPSSIEIISPSSIEVLNSGPASEDDGSPVNQACLGSGELTSATSGGLGERSEEARELLSVASLSSQVSVTLVEDLNSSVSSGRTVIDRDDKEVVSENLENMLSEAMVENEKKSCDGSSQSSDIAKLEYPSETSCDEFDNYTSTSSDVEVLSSPHSTRLPVDGRPCSSGSDEALVTNESNMKPRENTGEESLADPGKLKELLRLVEHQKLEMAELRKKSNDLSELVEARENRILAVSREISQVQEESGQMSVRLEAALREADKQREAAEQHKESVDRLNQDLSQQKKERTDLEKEMKKLRKEKEQKMGDESEKDEIISDLRSEGEALAKHNGKQAEIIRKLRAKEKTLDTDVKKLEKEVEKFKSENETLTQKVATKEESEGSLNKTLKSLTEANQAWELENKKVKNDLEDNIEKVNGLRSSLETAYREMAEMKHKLTEAVDEANTEALSNEVKLRKEAEDRLEEERRTWRMERIEFESRISNAQAALSACERSASEREEVCRREVAAMRLRLEESDNRHEDLAESISQASKPLLRQVESLQAALKETQSNAERVEQTLTERLKQTSANLTAAQDKERTVAEQYRLVSGKLAALESTAEQTLNTRKEYEDKISSLEANIEDLKRKEEKEEASHMYNIQKLKEELAEIRRDKEFLSVSLESEKAEAESRRKKSLALMEQLKERDRRVRELQVEMENRTSMSRENSVRSSPSPSLSQLSMSGSELFARDGWSDDVFPYNSSAISLYDSIKHGSSTAVVESIQAQLKIKEGELAQLQSQLAHSERVRESLSAELTSLSEKADMTEVLEAEMKTMRGKLSDLEAKYQTMLTMYGEKVEEAEELKLDLADVKEMYKTQIDQLLGKSD